MEKTPSTLSPKTDAPEKSSVRRPLLWAAAAVVVIGVLTSVRVECSPAPTCDLKNMHFSFMSSSSHVAIAPGAVTPVPASAAQQPKPLSPAQRQAFERDWLARKRLPTTAVPGAKVTVTIFLDWQCPACKAAEQAYGAVFADFERRMPGAVVVAWKDYPLNMNCNPNVPVAMHPAACEAAVAVRLAKEHNTAPALISYFFANQETLSPASVRVAAASIGKISDFDARFPIVLRDVAKDVAEGHSLEVGGTPTCFINGILARNDDGRLLFSPDEIRMAIETELKRVK